MSAETTTNPLAISSWSGGKDSCLACYKAIQRGYRVKYLLNFISQEYRRSCFHGITAELLKLQAQQVGIPLIQKAVGPDMQEYEAEFKQAVSRLKMHGVKTMVFGDIYLEEHRSWVERVCGALDIEPVEPLWGDSADRVFRQFIELGFKAMVVSCKADVLGKEVVGRWLDKDLLGELQKRQICPCGENGEFHTFVTAGPIFKKSIEITKSQIVLKEGFWRGWFLDIQDYRII